MKVTCQLHAQGKKPHSTHWIRGWVGLRTGLDAALKVKKKEKLPLCLTKHHAMKTHWGVEV
jgi:hypothetical protein